jgi:hypothetical protein
MATRAYFRAVLTALVAGLSCPVHAEVTFPPTVIYGSWDDLGGLIKFLSEHSDAVDRRLMAEHHRQMEARFVNNVKKDVRCYVQVPGVSESDAAAIRNTTSQSSDVQQWIAAEAMYRWYATTTPGIVQAWNREFINGQLAYRVIFADGGSAAHQILSPIPSFISPALGNVPIPNTQAPGSGQRENGAVCS